MKGKEAKRLPPKPELRLVDDLTPVTPPDAKMVLEEVRQFAWNGAFGLVDDDEAKDIAQEVVIKFQKRLAKDPWLWSDPVERENKSEGAGKYGALNRIKARKVREKHEPEVTEMLYPLGQEGSDPLQSLVVREFSSAAADAIERMSEEDQRLWFEVHDLGLRPVDIDRKRARSLSAQLSQIKKQLQFILRRFQPGRET